MAVSYDDEFVDVQGGGYVKTLKWGEQETDFTFVAWFTGAKTVNINGRDARINTFVTEDGEPMETYGAAILDGRLDEALKESDHPAVKVKVVYLGKNARNGFGTLSHNFKVGASPAAPGPEILAAAGS